MELSDEAREQLANSGNTATMLQVTDDDGNVIGYVTRTWKQPDGAVMCRFQLNDGHSYEAMLQQAPA